MNKLFAGAAVGLALGVFSAASAVDLSVGCGGFFASDFGAGFAGLKLKSDKYKIDQVTTAPWYGGGFNLFFDVTYVEMGVGFTFAGGEPKRVINGKEEDVGDVSLSGVVFNAGVLVKYPIAVREALTFFPAVGADYALCASAKQKVNDKVEIMDGSKGGPTAGDLSALWFRFGAGFDCKILEHLFLRPAVLYGIRLSNKVERDNVDASKKVASSDGTVESPLGHGLSVRLGIGYKFDSGN
jgi:hypothetical protein